MTGDEFRLIALSLQGTTEVPHFDRRAFRARRIFTTLAADGKTASICLTPDEQEFYIGLRPHVFSRVPNRWGDRGWTSTALEAADIDIVRSALTTAWKAASCPPNRRA